MSARVWIIDDDRSIRWVLEKTLTQAGFICDCFDRGDGVFTRLKRQRPAVIVSDVRMPGIDGLELLKQLTQEYPDIPVVIMTAHSDLESAVAAFQKGAFEYLPKPFDLEEAVTVISRALQNQVTPEEPVFEPTPTIGIVGEAPAMQTMFRAIGRLSQSNINVLINGASGTGKELVARAIHQHSPRHQQPFIAINMAALPPELVETDLFGSEQMYQGVQRIRQGRFELANQGTLFLDEIGDMPMTTQTRLLRVLADGEFYRVAGQTVVNVDVRILAATQCDLRDRVARGLFREDLFHRLNVINIHLPTLAERKEDIPNLCKHFLKQAAIEMHTDPKQLSEPVESLFSVLEWPGNVRQLENTCRLLTVMAPGREVVLSDVPADLQHSPESQATEDNWLQALKTWADREVARGQDQLLNKATPLFEAAMIEIALKHTGGRKRDAAEVLGWGRNTLTRKLKELSISHFDQSDDERIEESTD